MTQPERWADPSNPADREATIVYFHQLNASRAISPVPDRQRAGIGESYARPLSLMTPDVRQTRIIAACVRIAVAHEIRGARRHDQSCSVPDLLRHPISPSRMSSHCGGLAQHSSRSAVLDTRVLRRPQTRPGSGISIGFSPQNATHHVSAVARAPSLADLRLGRGVRHRPEP